jgi:hypothetical protein
MQMYKLPVFSVWPTSLEKWQPMIHIVCLEKDLKFTQFFEEVSVHAIFYKDVSVQTSSVPADLVLWRIDIRGDILFGVLVNSGS